MFEALAESERDAILDPKGTNRAAAKDASNKPAELPLNNKPDNEKTSTPVKLKKAQEDENQQSDTPNNGPGRPKKPKDPEKVAKVAHQHSVRSNAHR